MKNPEIEYVTNTPSSYYIALAAWRRGLNVTFIKNINNYRITSPGKSLFFCNSAVLGGRYGFGTYAMCNDKYRTKCQLQMNNIDTPVGKLFDLHSHESDIVSYAEQIGFPVVLKSNNGSRGVDVFPNLKNNFDLIKAWEVIKTGKEQAQFLIEKYIEGEDYKVFIVGKEAVAAYTRTPAKIIGDDKHTVKELIDIRNNLRSQNPHLKGSQLVIDEEVLIHLENENLTLDSVLPEGKVVYLRSKENVSVAGDLDDITSQLPDHLKKLAVRAIQSISHLKNGSVDIRYSKGKYPEGSVLEINSMAQIAGHLFPSSGNSQDVTSKMIDFYFPESVKLRSRNSDMFYNMKTIEKHFEAFPESDYTLAPAPVNETIRRIAIIHGDFKVPDIEYKIRNEARRLNLSGFIKSESTEQIEIVNSGEKKDIDLYADFLTDEIAGVKAFDIESYNKPIVNGF